MASHSNATREETPHVNQTSRTEISDAIRRRAEAVVRDRKIDAPTKTVIRYALEINDPWLAELVRRANAGESIVDTNGFLAMPVSGGED